jgi:hypothetical protein
MKKLDCVVTVAECVGVEGDGMPAKSESGSIHMEYSTNSVCLHNYVSNLST